VVLAIQNEGKFEIIANDKGGLKNRP